MAHEDNTLLQTPRQVAFTLLRCSNASLLVSFSVCTWDQSIHLLFIRLSCHMSRADRSLTPTVRFSLLYALRVHSPFRSAPYHQPITQSTTRVTDSEEPDGSANPPQSILLEVELDNRQFTKQHEMSDNHATLFSIRSRPADASRALPERTTMVRQVGAIGTQGGDRGLPSTRMGALEKEQRMLRMVRRELRRSCCIGT